MAKRQIIKIDEVRCNGCAECIPNCPEGAIQVINGKARLISDLFCDGLGACLGHCPQGAITICERDAQNYNEKKVMENIVKQGKEVIWAHLCHLKEHNEYGYLKDAMDILKKRKIDINPEDIFPAKGHASGCPSSKSMDLRKTDKYSETAKIDQARPNSQLSNWPVQIKLAPLEAEYFKDADLLIAADCAPFACANFHSDLLKGKALLIGCPKLDGVDIYEEKLTQLLNKNSIKSVTCAHMEVPCCYHFVKYIKTAISRSGKSIPYQDIVISIKGELVKQKKA
ncbi:MAG: 4Fe-4S dicluster domain-containing protein [Candidatus Omnitrophota bacterium]|nr:4Fe-4S ferredoxin [Candidatus Omnitrophota bacterium]